MAFTITPQHEAIFSWVTDPAPTKRAAIIDAVAGAGKTGTLIQILSRIPAKDTAIFLAFNTSAAKEVEQRAKDGGLARAGIDFRTLNSMGFRGLTSRFRGVRLEANKTEAMLASRLSESDRRTFTVTVVRLVSAAKSQGLVPDGVGGRTLLDDTQESWDALIDQFAIDAPGDKDRLMGRAVDIARKCLVAGLRDITVCDFDDQLYVTYALSLPLRRFDWLMVDEAQDLNPIQRHLIGEAITEGGRLIAVGDPFQAIYQFRGADSQSMPAIERQYDCATFPLSVTYRCPRAVVTLAQQIVPHIAAAETAPEGMVTKIENPEAVEFRPDDMILCRTNAPLVSFAYRLIRRRISCRVAGREIGVGLIRLIKRFDAVDLIDFSEKVEQFAAEEQERLERIRASDARLQAHADRCDCLRVLAEESKSLEEMEQTIADLFSDSGARLTLSSVHKAKGQERRRVFILNPELMPSKMARTAEQRQAERNIQYVAFTRARSELCFMSISEKHAEATKPAAKQEA